MLGHENEKVQKVTFSFKKISKYKCKIELHAENNHYATKTLKSKYSGIFQQFLGSSMLA